MTPARAAIATCRARKNQRSSPESDDDMDDADDSSDEDLQYV
jgi:hypothetical protein